MKVHLGWINVQCSFRRLCFHHDVNVNMNKSIIECVAGEIWVILQIFFWCLLFLSKKSKNNCHCLKAGWWIRTEIASLRVLSTGSNSFHTYLQINNSWNPQISMFKYRATIYWIRQFTNYLNWIPPPNSFHTFPQIYMLLFWAAICFQSRTDFYFGCINIKHTYFVPFHCRACQPPGTL